MGGFHREGGKRNSKKSRSSFDKGFKGDGGGDGGDGGPLCLHLKLGAELKWASRDVQTRTPEGGVRRVLERVGLRISHMSGTLEPLQSMVVPLRQGSAVHWLLPTSAMLEYDMGIERDGEDDDATYEQEAKHAGMHKPGHSTEGTQGGTQGGMRGGMRGDIAQRRFDATFEAVDVQLTVTDMVMMSTVPSSVFLLQVRLAYIQSTFQSTISVAKYSIHKLI